MWNIEKIDSSEGNVSKFVFSTDSIVAETVLYRYPDYKTRTVICCSTMSGCPMGCRFCGAGDFFVKALTGDQIVAQVDHALEETKVNPSEIERLQIMFMSMGEPLLNRKGMQEALWKLYEKYPNAALLISTSAPRVDYSWVNMISDQIKTVGLQFSVHESTDEKRDELIPFKAKLSLKEISHVGLLWHIATGRNPFFNYCAGESNSTEEDADRLVELFDPAIWNATVSVICERNEGLPTRNDHQRELAANFSSLLLERGFNVRTFDPAGQDDIGGGCGQLWYVQDWANKHSDKVIPSIGNGLQKVHVPKK